MDAVEEFNRFLDGVDVARMEMDRVEESLPLNAQRADQDPQRVDGAAADGNQQLPGAIAGVVLGNNPMAAGGAPQIHPPAAPGLAQGNPARDRGPGFIGAAGAANVQVAQLVPARANNQQRVPGAAVNAPQAQDPVPNAGAAGNGRGRPYRRERAGRYIQNQRMSQNLLRVIGDIGHLVYGRRGQSSRNRHRNEDGAREGGNGRGNGAGFHGP